MRHSMYLFLILSTFVYSSDFYYQNKQKVYLEKVSNSFRSYSNVDTFKDENNMTFGVSDEIVIELDEKIMSIEKIVAKYPLLKVEKIASRYYRCKVQERSKIFKIAAKIYHEQGVLSSHPNFIRQKYQR